VETPEANLSRAACFQRQRESDLLLHLGWTNPAMNGVLSAKVFEYMAAGIPVLSIGAERNTAIGELLAATGTGLCVGLEVSPIEALLDEMCNRGQYPAWYQPDRARLMAYTREAQAERLLGLLVQARDRKSIGGGAARSS
jgi:glycosyltransferase involved in cell wall biosynthesis